MQNYLNHYAYMTGGAPKIIVPGLSDQYQFGGKSKKPRRKTRKSRKPRRKSRKSRKSRRKTRSKGLVPMRSYSRDVHRLRLTSKPIMANYINSKMMHY